MIDFRLWGIDWKIWPSEVIGLAIIIAGVWLFWHAQRDPKNPMDFSTMFVWPKTKQMSLALFLAFWAGLISFWVVVDQELRNKLTPDIFWAFLTILIAGKAATEGINAWRSKLHPPDDGGGNGDPCDGKDDK